MKPINNQTGFSAMLEVILVATVLSLTGLAAFGLMRHQAAPKTTHGASPAPELSNNAPEPTPDKSGLSADAQQILNKVKQFYGSYNGAGEPDAYTAAANAGFITDTLLKIFKNTPTAYDQALCAQNIPTGYSYTAPVVYPGPKSAADSDATNRQARTATMDVIETFGPSQNQTLHLVVTKDPALTNDPASWEINQITCPKF